MHIAFITPEFVTDYRDGGGLGNYLNRIGKLLVERGHKVQLIVSSEMEPRVLEHNGIIVRRVPPFTKMLAARGVRRLCRVAGFGAPFELFFQARAMAAELERCEREQPFDVVQSSDYLAVGFCVPKRKGRLHLVRCSTAADLYNQIDGDNSGDGKWRAKMERASMARADLIYAPSRFVADHFQKRHGLPVSVVRPPCDLEIKPSEDIPCGLPGRFLVHFGQINQRKGSQWLAKALAQACDADPSIRMVWIGRSYGNELGHLLAPLAKHRSRILVMHPLPKAELLAVVQQAEAAVLPSLVDNLPNTVIESLRLGVPVIGTQGASIDELVEQDVTGELVAPNDVSALSNAILKIWRKQSRVKKGFVWQGTTALEMDPERAIQALLRLASLSEEGATVSLKAPVERSFMSTTCKSPP